MLLLLSGQAPTPAVSYDFLTNNTVASPEGIPLSFTRSTGARQYDATGKVVYAPENLLLQTSDLTNVAWGVSSGIATTQASGVLTVTENNGPFSNRFVLLQGYTTDSVRTFYTYSVKVKQQGAARSAAIRFDDSTNGGLDGGTLNLATGVFNNTPVTNSFFEYVGQTATLDPTDGFWLVTFTVIPKFPFNGVIRSNLLLADAAGNSNYTGDGSSGMLVKQPQLERSQTARPYNSTAANRYYGPRFDYNPSTLQPRGIQIEYPGTNQLAYSDTFTTTYYEGYFGKPSDLAKNATGPDGVPNSAHSFTLNGCDNFFAGSGFYYGGLVRVQPNSTGSYAVSLWVKADAGVVMNFGVTDGQGGPFTLTTQWQRITVTGTADGTAQSRIFQMFVVRNQGTNATLPLSTKIYIWCAQSEKNPNGTVSYATSPIQTNGAQGSRGADIANIPVSGIYNTAEGSAIIDYELAQIYQPGYGKGRMACLFEVTSSFFSHWMWAQEPTSNAMQFSMDPNYTINSGTPSLLQRMAWGWKTNDHATFQNGALVATNTTTPTNGRAVAQIRLGQYSDGYQIEGWIRNFKYFNRRIPNAVLQKATV